MAYNPWPRLSGSIPPYLPSLPPSQASNKAHIPLLRRATADTYEQRCEAMSTGKRARQKMHTDKQAGMADGAGETGGAGRAGGAE